MIQKKTISLRTLLIVEVILLIIGSFFVFQVEDLAAESQKEEETLQKIEFVKQQTANTIYSLNQDNESFSKLVQGEVDSIVYAANNVSDFEITDSLQNAFTFGTLLTNPTMDSSHKYATATANDGTVYALDYTDFDDTRLTYDALSIPDYLFPQLFEKNDLYFILDKKGTILCTGNSELEGQNISKLGVELSQIVYEDGIWLNINGKDYYTVASLDKENNYIYIGALNSSTFNINNNIASTLIVAGVFIIIFLLIMYTYFSRQDDKLKAEREGVEVKHKNMWIFAIIALLSITVFTYHIQSLFSVSMFTMVKNTESDILQAWVDTNKLNFPGEIRVHNMMNNEVTDNLASLLSDYPELQTTEHINNLAKMYDVGFIKLFDVNMHEIATTQISREHYEKYEALLTEHYPSSSIAPVEETIQAAEGMTTTATKGILNLDLTGANTVTIGFRLLDYLESLNNLDLTRVLNALSAPGNLEVLSVNLENKLVTYASMDDYWDIPVSRIGINDSSLQEKRLEVLKIDGVKYYSLTTSVNNHIIFLMEPAKIMFEGRVNMVMATTLFSGLCIAILLFLFSISEVNPPLVSSDENKLEKNDYFSKFLIYLEKAENWSNKNAEEKVIFVSRCILNLFVIIFLLVYFFRGSFFQNNTIFGFIVNGKWQRGTNLYAVTAVAITWLAYSFVMNIVNFVFAKLLSIANPRSETRLRLLRSFIIYLSMIALIFYCLYLLGMDSKSILASAGILSLVVSWGSQDLITDVLAGMFILFENQFQVGDIIEVDGQRGSVKEIGIRTTQVDLVNGDVFSISNRNLSQILNKSQTTSAVGIIVYVNFDQNIPEIENMLREELPKLDHFCDGILSGPYYSGLMDFTDQYARLVVGFTCSEFDRFNITCRMNAEICRLFDEHGFEMGIDPIEIKL